MDTIKIILQILTISLLGLLFYTVVDYGIEEAKGREIISAQICDINQRLDQWEAE